MTINTFQSGLTSAGHFDFLDADFSSIRGGEVVVFDSVHSDDADRTSDVYNPDGYRTVLRLATGADDGPFFLTDASASSSFPAPGFELTSLFATSQSHSANLDSSGKVGIFGTQGFYSISSDVVDTNTIDASTLVNTKLYVDPIGHLTTVLSASEKQVGYFIEFRSGTVLRSSSRPIQTIGAHRSGDTVIMYKSSDN